MIRFLITEELKQAMTWAEYESIKLAQEGGLKLYKLRPLCARFMVDDNRQALPHEQAMRILGALPLSELNDVMGKFAKAFSDAAIPNQSGDSLSGPLEATPASESPAG
jgi:hypothetical protein